VLKSLISKTLSKYITRSAANSENSSTKNRYWPDGEVAKNNESGLSKRNLGAEGKPLKRCEPIYNFFFFFGLYGGGLS
jgi:hypothetical protein